MPFADAVEPVCRGSGWRVLFKIAVQPRPKPAPISGAFLGSILAERLKGAEAPS